MVDEPNLPSFAARAQAAHIDRDNIDQSVRAPNTDVINGHDNEIQS